MTTGEVSVWFGIVIYMGVHSSPSGCGLTTRAMVDTLNPTLRLDTLRTDQEIHAHAPPPPLVGYNSLWSSKFRSGALQSLATTRRSLRLSKPLAKRWGGGGGRCLCIKW